MENCFSVVKVRCCAVRNFSAVVSNGYAEVCSSLWENVAMCVPASLNVSESVKNGERIVKSILKFDSMMNICRKPGTSSLRKNFCYELTCADGTKFLLGTHAKPFAKTTMIRNLGSVTSNQAYQYQIVLEDNKSLPIIT